MNVSKRRNVALADIALIAATRGALGFGAGLLLADKFGGDLRKVVGWSLFLAGALSTIPIALHVLGRKQAGVAAG